MIVVAMLAATAWLVIGTLRKHNVEQGLASLERGDYTQAALCLEKAARYSLRPDAAVLFHLAEARLKLGDITAAKGSLEKVISLEPRNAAARYELGKIYVNEKNFGAARSEISALEEIGSEAVSYTHLFSFFIPLHFIITLCVFYGLGVNPRRKKAKKGPPARLGRRTFVGLLCGRAYLPL